NKKREYLLKLKDNKYKWHEIADKMHAKYGKRLTAEQCRWEYRKQTGGINRGKPNYNESIEIKSDGSHKSDKLLRMNSEQQKDVNYLLTAHRYDVNEWQLVSARNNIWNTNDKKKGVQTLYSSKITVKPKVNGSDFDKLLDAIKETPKYIVDTYQDK